MFRFSSSRVVLSTLALVIGFAAFLTRPAEALICPHFFCHVKSDCLMFCPSQPNAQCVDNVCQYPS